MTVFHVQQLMSEAVDQLKNNAIGEEIPDAENQAIREHRQRRKNKGKGGKGRE